MYCPFCGEYGLELFDAEYTYLPNYLHGGKYYCYKCRKEVKIIFDPYQVDFVENKNIELDYLEPN